jgi:hypothetical protein
MMGVSNSLIRVIEKRQSSDVLLMLVHSLLILLHTLSSSSSILSFSSSLPLLLLF